MDEPSYEIHSAEKPPERWLDSWKEIAAYLNRDVTTVQRWEKREGMPVHRHVHDKRGSVYALPEELDEWIRSRKASVDEPEKKSEAEMPQAAPSGDGAMAGSKARLWVGVNDRSWVASSVGTPGLPGVLIESPGAMGIRISKTDPRSGPSVADRTAFRSPFSRRTMPLATMSPSPRPSRWLSMPSSSLENALNSLGMNAAGIPMPVSEMVTTMPRPRGISSTVSLMLPASVNLKAFCRTREIMA